MRIIAMLFGLWLCGCSAGQVRMLTDVAGALSGHLGCALECAACIQAIHGEEGDGFDAAVADQARCAAACAHCGVSMAEDCAVVAAAGADAGGSDVDVEPEPLPPSEVRERVAAALSAYQAPPREPPPPSQEE